MQFKKLELKNFRNYDQLTLDLPSGVSIFYGSNGNGKTNLLEALFLLIRGESFRPAAKESFIGSKESTQIFVTIEKDGLEYLIKANISREEKSYYLNDKKISPAKLAQLFPVVLFSPESLASIKEGPEQRRQLLDDVVLMNSGSRDRIIYDYKRCLRTRNKILRDFKTEKSSKSQSNALLNSLDPIFLPIAAELTVARLEALNMLSKDLCTAANAVLDPLPVDISVDYLISDYSAANWSRADVISAMHKRGQELREQELLAGSSLIGPHRHDIRFLFAGKDSRFFCSQGQQRALILSFKMAQILYHYRTYQTYPFLLLDDVLSELDPSRRTNLIKFLKDIPSQIILTTTDLSFTTDFGDRSPKIFRVERGNVLRE